jgi:hypothetical protein
VKVKVKVKACDGEFWKTTIEERKTDTGLQSHGGGQKERKD